MILKKAVLILYGVQTLFNVSIVTLSAGCDGTHVYAGDVEDVGLVVRYANGATGTFHFGKAAGIIPQGTLVAVKLRLKQFPGKEFTLPEGLGERTGLITQGTFRGLVVVSVATSWVELSCRSGSTDVVTLSLSQK